MLHSFGLQVVNVSTVLARTFTRNRQSSTVPKGSMYLYGIYFGPKRLPVQVILRHQRVQNWFKACMV